MQTEGREGERAHQGEVEVPEVRTALGDGAYSDVRHLVVASNIQDTKGVQLVANSHQTGVRHLVWADGARDGGGWRSRLAALRHRGAAYPEGVPGARHAQLLHVGAAGGEGDDARVAHVVAVAYVEHPQAVKVGRHSAEDRVL